MQVQKLPYEVLFRFDESGALSGSHVQWRYVVTDDDGSRIAEAIDTARPVAVGKNEGFPLDTILTKVQEAAIIQAEAKTAEADQLRDELTAKRR